MKSSKKSRGLVAAGAAAALLAVGGGTFALWSADDTVNGGAITGGNVQVNTLSQGWYDTSADAAGATAGFLPVAPAVTGAAIANIANFAAVPGDKLTFVAGLDVALEGDNLKAALNYAPPVSVNGDATYSSQLWVKDAGVWKTVTGPVTLQSDDGTTAPGVPVIDRDLPAGGGIANSNAMLVVDVVFKNDASGSQNAELAKIDSAGVTLTQVR